MTNNPQNTNQGALPLFSFNESSFEEQVKRWIKEALHEFTAEKLQFQKEESDRPIKMKEACEYLNVKESTIYKLMKDGLLKSSRPGRSHLFFKKDLMSAIQRGRKIRREGKEKKKTQTEAFLEYYNSKK